MKKFFCDFAIWTLISFVAVSGLVILVRIVA